MTVLHTGWTKKFGSAWDSIFGGKKKTSAKPQAAKTSAAQKKSAKKKATTKKASKRK